MVFASTQFLFAFLPLFFLCYYGIGRLTGIRGKNIVLLLFSLVFYGWGEPLYILLMVYSTVLDYTCGRMIEKGRVARKPWLCRLFLAVSLIGNLVPLGLFKYADWLLLSANHLFDVEIPLLGLTMPIGISFYTFQTMSYSIDVYRGKIAAQRNILYFGAYVVMFPQLIAGPVVRYTYVADRLNDRTETFDDVASGLRRFLMGFGKKVLIANVMGEVCDGLFAVEAAKIGALGAWVAIISYTFHIYFDFSGYSDMAVGLGRMMGFEFPENFNYPYISRSVTEFWRRWHITMSTFFRDYVYIPLGGNRVKPWRWVLNVLIVWAATGLWHGSSWNFVLWGLYFAVFLLAEKFLLGKLLGHSHVLSRVWTMVAVIYGWAIFNATEDRGGLGWLGEFTKALTGSYGVQGTALKPAVTQLLTAGFGTVYLITLAGAILFSTPVIPWIRDRLEAVSRRSAGGQRLADALGAVGDVLLLVVLVFSVGELAIGSYNPFIYFRF